MKDCLIIGPAYITHYDEIFEIQRKNILKYGIYTVGWEEPGRRCWAKWYTTLNVKVPENKKLVLTKTYNEKDPPYCKNCKGGNSYEECKRCEEWHDKTRYCDVIDDCTDCPRYGDDCDGRENDGE